MSHCRVCQENDLSPKIIYGEELKRLQGEGQDIELQKRLPSYDSLKSTLYKVKNKSVKASTSAEENMDYLSSNSGEEEVSVTEV